jgi:hypothetical protein
LLGWLGLLGLLGWTRALLLIDLFFLPQTHADSRRRQQNASAFCCFVFSSATCGAKMCNRCAIKTNRNFPGTSAGAAHLTCPEGMEFLTGQVGRANVGVRRRLNYIFSILGNLVHFRHYWHSSALNPINPINSTNPTNS